MGASLQFVEYNTQDIKELKKRFRSDVEDTAMEIEHDFYMDYPDDEFDSECLMYTGTIYELQEIEKVYSKVAKDYEEAEEILYEHHNKWDGAMVVHMENGHSLVGGWCSE